jgi:hypothetical protein
VHETQRLQFADLPLINRGLESKVKLREQFRSGFAS